MPAIYQYEKNAINTVSVSYKPADVQTGSGQVIEKLAELCGTHQTVGIDGWHAGGSGRSLP